MVHVLFLNPLARNETLQLLVLRRNQNLKQRIQVRTHPRWGRLHLSYVIICNGSKATCNYTSSANIRYTVLYIDEEDFDIVEI